MVVAGRAATLTPAVPRVGTKYPRVATEHFASRGVHAEVIFLQSSVELAPLLGLCDVIVDIVETGGTLRDNGLVIHEEICPISSVVIANRAEFKLRRAEVEPILAALRRAVEVRASGT